MPGNVEIIYKKPKRPITKCYIHCSASDHAHHDDISVIRGWHVNERGFSDVGYHFFIKSTGEVQEGRSLEKVPAAQKGHNTDSIAICLHGNDLFKDTQFRSLRKLCHLIEQAHPGITFHGHCEVEKGKLCPNFDYKGVLGLNLSGQMTPVQKMTVRLPWYEKFVKMFLKGI